MQNNRYRVFISSVQKELAKRGHIGAKGVMMGL
jgi:hypothetical protein